MSFSLNDPNPGYPEIQDREIYSFRESRVNTQCPIWDRDHMLELFSTIENGTFVEIGIFGGATLLHLFEQAVKSNSNLIGIDPHDKIDVYNGKAKEEVSESIKEYTRNLFLANRTTLQGIIEKYNLSTNIKYINEFSAIACESFDVESIDMLHVDGDHSTKGIYDDLVNYWPKMKKGGIVVCDDYDWQPLRIGIKQFTDEYNLQGEVYNNRKFIIRK